MIMIIMMKMISGSNAIWRALPLLESPPLSSQVLSMSSKLGDGGHDDGHDDDDDDDDDIRHNKLSVNEKYIIKLSGT